jgi:hypothetical protein
MWILTYNCKSLLNTDQIKEIYYNFDRYLEKHEVRAFLEKDRYVTISEYTSKDEAMSMIEKLYGLLTTKD